jgi:hypothetical protein
MIFANPNVINLWSPFLFPTPSHSALQLSHYLKHVYMNVIVLSQRKFNVLLKPNRKYRSIFTNKSGLHLIFVSLY